MSTKTMMQSEEKNGSKSGRSDRHACSGSGDPDAFLRFHFRLHRLFIRSTSVKSRCLWDALQWDRLPEH